MVAATDDFTDPPPDSSPSSSRAAEATVPMRAQPFTPLARLGDLGSVAQSSVPGLYAWAVTVSPAAWSKGAPWVAKVAAMAGLASLVGAAAVEARAPRRARAASVWGLGLTSSIVWLAVPGALGPTRLDAARGITGMVGWALFAYAAAAPALKRPAEPQVYVAAPLKARSKTRRGDMVYVGAGAIAAFALQLVGWGVLVPERALLVRLTTLAVGLAVLGAATDVGLARHAKRLPVAGRLRRRVFVTWLALTVLAGAVGGLFWALR